MSVENGTVEESKTEEVAKPEGISSRDALEVALETVRDREKPVEKELKETPQDKPADKPVMADSPAKPSVYEPPGEWNREEKEDFKSLSPKQQEATLRLHKSRSSTLENIKAEKAELEWAREIAKEVTPFLKTRGDKEPAHSQVLKALRLVNELDANTHQGVVNILKAKGLAVPKELEVQPETKKYTDPALQQEVNAIKMRLAQEDHAKNSSVMSTLWQSFEGAKNAAGSSRFPDVSDTDAGLRLASNIGSLVSGQTEMSKQFIANAQNRIPNLSAPRLFEEAYRFYGGRVDDSEATRTQDTQKHVVKSSRAASSVPGRGGQSQSGPVKKLPYREAAKQALEMLRERDGH